MGLKMGAGSSTAEAGELQVISIIASSAPGLSPLARGTRRKIFMMGVVMAVYPRWRGELGAAVFTFA